MCITNKTATEAFIQYYFGQTKDLIGAAINRAYADMASHTLRIDSQEDKKKCKEDAAKKIRHGLEKYDGEKDYNTWHSELIRKIETIYSRKNICLSEGQLQKWLNMTVKYIYLMKQALSPDASKPDDRLKSVEAFFDHTSVEDYYPPIDSYILKAIGEGDQKWSRLDQTQYKKMNEKVTRRAKEKGMLPFEWEFDCWKEARNGRNKP